MAFLYETHLHTRESSRCGQTPAREYVPYYLDHGYQGIVVTDHFTGNKSYVGDPALPWREQMNQYCRGYEEALDEGVRRGLDVFFGVEQKFADDECLIYGVDKQWLCDHPDIASWGRARMLREVEAVGGCIVLAHPFRVRDYVSKISLNTCVHAVEAFNAHNMPVDDVYGLAYAARYGYPMTAGSDIHNAQKQTPERLYGVVFAQKWQSIGDYVRAIRTKAPFGTKKAESRGIGAHAPLARPYEYLNADEQPVAWDAEGLFR